MLFTDPIDEFVSDAATEAQIPYQTIAGTGSAWYYNPLDKTMNKVERGTEVVKFPDTLDNRGRVLVRTSRCFIMVPENEVVDIGFN